ncbi:MAG TPA: hypothetical protein ENJ20_02585, partial [Bacteroidetes bacterium]|nr:hypothetical protein [Bacteroidota bacterium]
MKKAPTVSLLLTLPFYLFSQLQITGTGTFNADLSGFTGSGFHPTPASGQLDSDTWRVTGFSDGDGTFGGTHTTGDFARGSHSGGVTTGGVYKFGGRLGVQPTDADFTPGTITLRIQNVSGSPITEFQINYTVSSYNDQNRA